MDSRYLKWYEVNIWKVYVPHPKVCSYCVFSDFLGCRLLLFPFSLSYTFIWLCLPHYPKVYLILDRGTRIPLCPCTGRMQAFRSQAVYNTCEFSFLPCQESWHQLLVRNRHYSGSLSRHIHSFPHVCKFPGHSFSLLALPPTEWFLFQISSVLNNYG